MIPKMELSSEGALLKLLNSGQARGTIDSYEHNTQTSAVWTHPYACAQSSYPWSDIH